MFYAAQKKLKKAKKNKDLPSFLLKTSEIPENVTFPPKITQGTHHSGPIFFGCHEYKPILHNLNLGHSHEMHKTASSTENVLRDAFITKTPTEKYKEQEKKFFFSGKSQVLFSDPYLHKCPGQRKIFIPEPPSVTDLGETKTIIEGEASQEIPLYCFWKIPDGVFEAECELIWLSDIWEKNRIFMSPKERMAHTHFPKEFVTYKVIGPTVPAPITVTKIPIKRRTSSQLNLNLKGKTKTKKEGKIAKTEKEIENIAEEKEKHSISDNILPSEEQTMEVVKSDAVEKKESETNEEIDRQKFQSGNNITKEEEEADLKDVADDLKENVEIKEEDDIKEVENEATEEVFIEE